MKKVIALATSLLVLAGCSEPDTTVRLATHDSFAMSDELIAQFEQDYGYQLEIIRLGDTGTLTNQLILTKDAPIADLVYGIDNTFRSIAEEDIFTPVGLLKLATATFASTMTLPGLRKTTSNRQRVGVN